MQELEQRRSSCRKPQRAQQIRATPSWGRQNGITYIEVILVVLILTIIAAVSLPNLSSNDSRRLDLAAEDVSHAIRFARAEAMRTGITHGIVFSSINDTAKVYSMPGVMPIYDVYHPVDKKLYDLNLKTDSATAGVDLQSYGIYYGGSAINQPYLGFNAFGNPKYSIFGTDYMLDSANITLAYTGHTRVVNVSPMTGRVTVQ